MSCFPGIMNVCAANVAQELVFTIHKKKQTRHGIRERNRRRIEMRRYNKWAGHKKGTPEDERLCIVEVHDSHGWLYHQCLRKRGYGENGLYCKQHAKMIKEGRYVFCGEEEDA